MKDEHLDQLISAHLHGALTSEQRAELEQRLLHSANDRHRFWEEADTHALLHAYSQTGLGEMQGIEPLTPLPSARVRRYQWRPLTAAAAGLVAGLFSASLVFGFVVPSLKTRIEILSDGFEFGAKPAVDGRQPFDPGGWGGDFTEVVGAQGRVKPAEGGRMLRFLRADYEGRHLPESFSCDSFRLIDLRPYKKEFAYGTAVVRLSALFNGEVNAADGPFACGLMLYALDADLVAERKAGTFTDSIRKRMLANSSSTRVRLDADPQTWQRADNELRLPPGTDYLMVQVGMGNESKLANARRDAFAAQFVDRVQVVLGHVQEVPLP
jgi:hypothetical protein